MTIARTHTWTTNEVLTAAEINAVDANVTNAVDMRAGALDIASQDVAVWVPLTAVQSTNWTLDYTSGTTTWANSNTATVGTLVLPIHARGNTLKSITVNMTGGAIGHANFPGTMPQFILIAQSATAVGAPSTLETVNSVANGAFGDTPTVNFANVIANYNGNWSVTMSNGGAGFGDRSHANNNMLYLVIRGESGANALNNSLMLLGVKATWTCTKLYPTG